jgi:signal transduction histidine kinase
VINRRIGDTQQVEGESLDLVKDRLQRITRQVTNCIDISRRYLSFLRQDPMERTKVGVNQILADLGELLKVHPSVGRNKLSIHELPEDVAVEINGTDLIQILLNLTINALQASELPHEVTITGAYQRRPLEMELMRDGPHDRVVNRSGFKNGDQLLVLAVRDDGPGIPKDVLAHLFEAYFTTKGEGKGTGLGLTIVKRLVTEADGLLHLGSRPDSGTTFTVYFPAVPRV